MGTIHFTNAEEIRSIEKKSIKLDVNWRIKTVI
jgi:hypothetical protein